MRFENILLILLISILVVQPVIAINSCHQFPTPDGKYLTVEVNGNLVEVWIRENPYYCNNNDKLLGSLNPAAINNYYSQNPTGSNRYTYSGADSGVDNTKNYIDAASLGWDLGSCIFWGSSMVVVGGVEVATYSATLTGVGTLPAAVAIPFETIGFLYVTGQAAMSCSQAAGDLFVQAIDIESMGGRQIEPQFKVTSGTYSETANLDQAVKNEFGNDYSVADWTDITAHSGDIQNWASNIGMNHGDYYFVTWNGQGFWNGGNRHYFITRFDGAVDSNYLVHDQISNNFITLGSWYGIQERVLAIRTSNAILPAQQTFTPISQSMPSVVPAQSTVAPSSSNQVYGHPANTYYTFTNTPAVTTSQTPNDGV